MGDRDDREGGTARKLYVLGWLGLGTIKFSVIFCFTLTMVFLNQKC
jgi:hypothetical protein